MSRLTITGSVLRVRDGFAELVIEHDLDGRLCICLHDETGPGYAATFDRETSTQIAEFIKADR